MKRGLSVLFLGMAVMLVLSMTAFADSVIQFTGGVESSYNGYGTGMYSGTLNGVNTQFICDDSTHDIQNSDTWHANAWTLGQVATAGNGAFAGSPYATATYATSPNTYTVAQVYSAAAYLANLIFTGASSDVNGIQYAIWALMDGPPAASNPGTGGYWINQGLSHDNYTNNSIVFYSPDGNAIFSGPDTGGTGQEFIGETPEPISMALMGTFLTLAGLGLGKKKLFT